MDILKKGTVIMLVSVMLAIVLISCAPSPLPSVSGADQNSIQEEKNSGMNDFFKPEVAYQPEMGSVVMYSLNKEDFQKFLIMPSIDVLYEKSYAFATYKNSDNYTGYVEMEKFSQKGVTKNEDSFFWLFPWKMNTSLIAFIKDSDNFEEILAEHGIDEEILAYVIVEHSTYISKDNQPIPPGTYTSKCIWIHTDAGDYFLERSEASDDVTFQYDFYDLTEFLKKYGNK